MKRHYFTYYVYDFNGLCVVCSSKKLDVLPWVGRDGYLVFRRDVLGHLPDKQIF